MSAGWDFVHRCIFCLSQAHRCSSTSGADTVRLGKGSVTRRAAKTTFENDQLDRILSQVDVSLHPRTAVTDLLAVVLTMRTGSAAPHRDHFQTQTPILVPLLHDSIFSVSA